MTADEDALFYYRGEEIRVGDTVQRPGAVAIIKELVAPGQEWAGSIRPDGLIVIEEDWDGISSSILFEPYTAGWEDMTFVKHEDGGN